MEVKIKEIFESIQGEGPFVGFKQLFIRFCGCNLHCKYCDTNFDINDALSYTPEKLSDTLKKNYDLEKIHSISLTGGEPLLHADFLNAFLPYLDGIKVYLETNATLVSELLKVKDKLDIISADIKLPSATGKNTFDLHDKFLSTCNGVNTFAKVVFDKNITDDEIIQSLNLAKKYDIELILQPKMNDNIMCSDNIFNEIILNKYLKHYSKVRLIPQVHKFINVR